MSLPFLRRYHEITIKLLDANRNLRYKTRTLMDYIHRPGFSIDHDVSETEGVSETS
jgi:hypothetical protein